MAIKIIIIGAGAGGTAAAARLSKKGFNVEVYEKNSYNGGRCSLINHNGHRFDQGPSLYLLPKIFEETFQDLGEDINNHIELLKCPSNYSVHFHDGKVFELTTDLSKLSTELEKYEGDKESTLINFFNFLKEAHIHYKKGINVALKIDFQNWYNFFNPKYLPLVMKLHIFDNVYNRISKYFKSDYMRKAFTFQTMYLGMSPYDAAAPYNLLQYTELAEGIWYPKGGFNKVLQSLENIAIKHGAEFNYNSDVKEILIDDNGVAKGIKLQNGSIIDSDIVICNADLVYAYNKLLPNTPYADKLGKQKLTSSSISFYWSMKKIIPQLNMHNIFLSENYKESFDQIFKDHKLPDEPSFYVNAPSRLDPTAAPEGKDSIVILVPVGHLTNKPNINFDNVVNTARQQVIEIMEKRLKITNLRSLIEHEIVNDPRTWQSEFNLWKGSILGLSHSIFQICWFRPSLKCKIFDNLYFVGASAQPGTGVPLVLCGAKLLENQICNKYLSNDDKKKAIKSSSKFITYIFSLFIFIICAYLFI
ncbi:hypothetical protein HCN44_000495 [Aphidius gifuensis]|uniref:Phytoene desaturase n=1 Tax=Aphidius gifuensis TaxID=684658 RepID=A0A834XP23_APHGI|nr:phytoene desaturase-like [Aphidius gifuensis]KAF7990690.1 hypothetical protein HCN44_000495 [Aphidius gifuensis]